MESPSVRLALREAWRRLPISITSALRIVWKVLSRVFPENEASLRLCRSLGFREVGIYRRHAKLDGAWKDVVIVEKLLGDAARED